MTVKELRECLDKHSIPETAEIECDFGWEYWSVSVDAAFYHEGKNLVMLTDGSDRISYKPKNGWTPLVSEFETLQEPPVYDWVGGNQPVALY